MTFGENNIIIKVKGSGEQKICSDFHKPNEIYLLDNSGVQNLLVENSNVVTLVDEESTLLLKYNDESISATGLFSDLSNIIDINLSNCILKDMASMFTNCVNLKTITLDGINTNEVHDLYNLFNNCHNLISVDLSYFDFSNVNDFRNIFSNCTSLEYINLQSYDESILGTLMTGIEIESDILKNIIICVNEEKAPNLYTSINEGKCSLSYCGSDWKQKRLKYDADSDSCIENNDGNIDEDNEEILNTNLNRDENIYLTTIIDRSEVKKEILKDFFVDNIFNNINNNKEMKNVVDDIINAIKEGEFKNYMNEYNQTELANKKDNNFYQIATLSSQLNNNEIAFVNLGDCEAKLRNISNINPDEELIIFKISKIIPETHTQVIEYTIFTIDGVQLNLDICKDFRIQYDIPIQLSEKDIYKHDPNSDFYNDKCIQYTSETGTDMTNYDRKEQFNEKNLALCENDCEFKEYNKKNKKVICDCKVKNVFNTFDEIDKRKLLKKFTNYKNIFNLDVFKCSKLLFSKKGLVSNIGSYIILSIIFLHIINDILFIAIGYPIFYNRINKIIINDNNNNLSKNNNNQPIRVANTKKSKTTLGKKSKKKSLSFPPNKRKFAKKSKSHKQTKKQKQSTSKISLSKEIYLSKNEINKIPTVDKININNNTEMNDFEMNSLSYQDAQKIDFRSFSEYYLSLIKTKQLIAFTFFLKSDYNSQIIKINSFFTSFCLYYTIKALFFNDNVMHVIYQNAGVYDFIFQIPQILYSTIISAVIGVLLSKLTLTQANIAEIKNTKSERDSLKYKTEFNKFKKIIKIKLILFFVINFVLLILFWYYLSSFCAVYKNTQIYLIKDVLISFGLSLIYPFAINIFPCIFRIYSLKERNNKHKYSFIFSKILQLI